MFHLVEGSTPLLLLEFKDCCLFQGVTSVGQESLIVYKGFANNHLAKNVRCAYDLSIWLIHVSQSLISTRNYHTVDAAITVLVCSQLKVTRSGAMKQSEVTHIVMQWRGFSFFYLRVFLSIYPFCLLYFTLYFHYHLPAPSLSHARWGKMYAGAQVERGEKSIVRVFEVFWKTSQGRRSCQGDR